MCEDILPVCVVVSADAFNFFLATLYLMQVLIFLLAIDLMSLDDSHSLLQTFASTAITEFVTEHVRSAYLKAESNRELHYILPFEEAKKGRFEKLFSALDVSLDNLNIASYGIADTNLEEVFLKITEHSAVPGLSAG